MSLVRVSSHLAVTLPEISLMTNRAVGIDLGTTYSAIAQVNKHGVPEILANAEGDRITPSVVLFDGDDIVVGNYAKQAAVAYPDQVVDFVQARLYPGSTTSLQ